MSKEKLGQEPVFPQTIKKFMETPETGMSKRFYAACAAMQGLIAKHGVGSFPDTKPTNVRIFVEDAYMIADELLKQEKE